MPYGTPSMLRARYEEDAELLVREQAARRRPPRSRGEFVLFAVLLALFLVGWGLLGSLA